jgi:hypothetical protein
MAVASRSSLESFEVFFSSSRIFVDKKKPEPKPGERRRDKNEIKGKQNQGNKNKQAGDSGIKEESYRARGPARQQ